MPEYVDLRPGQRINVLKDAGTLEVSYVSTIRHVSPVAVRIDAPRRGDDVLDFKVNDEMMIMVDLQGRLYTFASRVQKIEPADDAVLIDRPRVVEQSERRQFFRLAVNIRPKYAAIVDDDGSEKRRLEAMILDISGGGMQLRAKQPIDTGNRVHVVFPLGDDQLEADITVLAASAVEGEAPWMYRANARFLTLPRQVQERIIRFIFKQQLDFMKRGVR